MAGISLFLSACAGAHFHNPNNAQLANLAASSLNDIVKEVDTEFNKETKNRDRLREPNWRFTFCTARSMPSNNAKRLLSCCFVVAEHV